jgi:hypothetical protein
MSHILTSILTSSLGPYDSGQLASALNAHIDARHTDDLSCRYHQWLAAEQPIKAGTRAIQLHVLFGAFNFGLVDELVGVLRTFPWESGAVVQLAVNCEYDEGVRLLTIVGVPTVGCCAPG